MTLADFLLARIAEDEAVVKAGPDYIVADLTGDEPDGGYHWTGIEYGEDLSIGPDRVLAECEAKRRIIEWVTNAQRYAAEGQPGAFDPEDAQALTHALRLLALPYADHPDYREEWRP